jgi:hypothetical protein
MSGDAANCAVTAKQAAICAKLLDRERRFPRKRDDPAMFITPILPVSGYKCSGCSVFRSCSG